MYYTFFIILYRRFHCILCVSKTLCIRLGPSIRSFIMASIYMDENIYKFSYSRQNQRQNCSIRTFFFLLFTQQKSIFQNQTHRDSRSQEVTLNCKNKRFLFRNHPQLIIIGKLPGTSLVNIKIVLFLYIIFCILFFVHYCCIFGQYFFLLYIIFVYYFRILFIIMCNNTH